MACFFVRVMSTSCEPQSPIISLGRTKNGGQLTFYSIFIGGGESMLATMVANISFNKTTVDNLKTISLCKKTYLLMSSQSQPPSPSPIIVYKHFRDTLTPLCDYVICEQHCPSCFAF